jgi:Mn2+/Fe2+ NRAMP family transporter
MSQPQWLSDDSDSPSPPAPTVDRTEPSVVDSTSAGGSAQYKSLALNVLAFINIGVSVFMAATGALGVKYATEKDDEESSTEVEEKAQNVFVGIYMCLFAFILCFFELVQLVNIDYLQNVFKRNFGFLYGKAGKCMYILFMAVICFGLSEPKDVSLACGIIVGVWGPVQFAYFLRFPDHFNNVEKYKPHLDINLK